LHYAIKQCKINSEGETGLQLELRKQVVSLRKKSHVSLANHLIERFESDVCIKHTTSFKFGNLAPDLVPTFITKRHEINSTFDIVEKKINRIVETYDYSKGLTRLHTKDLGVIIHYIADYFTFPHNETYTGTLKEHCTYEKELKYALNAYVKRIDIADDSDVSHQSTSDICEYIRECHTKYKCQLQNLQNDCRHIVQVCANVIRAIFDLIFGRILVYHLVLD